MVKLRLLLIIILICGFASGKPLTFGIASALPADTPDYVLNDLNNYIADKLGRNVNPIMEEDYDKMNSMVENREVDFASVCTTSLNSKVRILAIPEINGKHSYTSYIIVGKKSSVRSIKDFKDKSFAFTDRLTGSGSLYPAFLIARDFKTTPEKVFKKVYYTQSNDQSIYLVNKGVVEAAAVDGDYFESIRKSSPKNVENVAIIHKSPAIIAPPFVASSSMSEDTYQKLKYVLLNMHNDVEGKKLLNLLNIDRFVSAKRKDYETLDRIKRAVEKYSSNQK